MSNITQNNVHNFGLLETVTEGPLLPPHKQPANWLNGVWAVQADKYRITLIILKIFVTSRYCERPPLRHKISTNSLPRAWRHLRTTPIKTWNLLADKSSSPNVQPLTYLAQGHRSRWLSWWWSRSRNSRRSSSPPPTAWRDPRRLPGTGTRIRRLRRRWESGASRCWREWERRVLAAGASSCVHAEMTRLSRRYGPLTLWHSLSEEYPPARRECKTPVPRKSRERGCRNLRPKKKKA